MLMVVSGRVSAADATRPNIVFILADDLGYGEVSFNGQQRYATPNIDRLAAEGLVMTSHYAGSSVCAPSRNALMTGQHTGHTAIRGNAAAGGRRVPLAPRDITIAERLRAAGYRTGLIGKWGLGEHDTGAAPWLRGWDEFFGFVNQSHAHNQFPEFLYRGDRPVPIAENFSHRRGRYANDMFVEEAERFVERAAAEHQPFFLFVSFTAPHAELDCPDDALAEVVSRHPGLAGPGVDTKARAFAAMVVRLDRDVGRLVARLDELGLTRDTLVIFTADNGPHAEDGKDPSFFRSSGPFRGIKRDLYEGGIRVPFIARWPGSIAAGVRTDVQFAFWDFSATALELAGVPLPVDHPSESVSYLPLLIGRGEEQVQHAYLYWEVAIGGQSRRAARAGIWKAVCSNDDTAIELYDLASDPAERTDLAGVSPDRVADFLRIFREAHEDSTDFPLSWGDR